MKGVEPLIAAILIMMISIAGAVIVLQFAQPSVDRLKEISLFEESKKILTQIDNAVRTVSEEGEGSTRVLQLSVSGGSYLIDTYKNAVMFSMDSRSQIIGIDISQKEGNVNMFGEPNQVLLNVSYSNINITGGGSFGKGYHVLIIRNNGYDYASNKQIISISLVAPSVPSTSVQYNQVQTLVLMGTNTTSPDNLNDPGSNYYSITEGSESGGQHNYFQDNTRNITGFNTTSAYYTNSLDNQNYNVTSTVGQSGWTTTKQYNQTQTVVIEGTNTTSPSNLNLIDGQTYNITESGTTTSESDTSSDLETGTNQKKVSASVTSYNVKTGARSTGTTATTVTFSNAMPSASYSVLISGSTDSDTMYSMAYLNKGTGSFQIKAEDDTGAGEASTNAQWMAIEFGDSTFSGIPIKCGTNSSAIVSGTNTINFPSAFSNISYAVIANPIDNADSPLINYISGSKTTTTMQIRIENDAGAAQSVAEFNYCGFIMGEYSLGSINIKARNTMTAASGDTTVTFGTAFPSTSYTVVAMAQSTAGAQCAPEVVTKNVGSFTIHFEDDAGANCANRPFDWLAITTGENAIYSSIPITDQNTTYTTYNNVYSGSVLDTITNISITVNVLSYNKTGSSGRSSNPDLWLELSNGASTWFEVDNISVNAAGSFTVWTTDATILSWWQDNPTERNIRIKGRYFDANATSWDEINYTDVWVKIDSKKTTYRAEIEHNTTVSYSGTLNSINISINFSTNVTSGFNLTVYNFNSGLWDYTSCQNGTANAGSWNNWWCNVTDNPSYYNSSTGKIRVRLNETDHSSLAMVREEYVQYYVTNTTPTLYANISVEHNSSSISENPSLITKINVTTIMKTNISSGIPFNFYIFNFNSLSWEPCIQTSIGTTYNKMECVRTINPSYYISNGRVSVRLNSSGNTLTHQMMEDYLVYQITAPSGYRIEVEHNATGVSWLKSLINISVLLNFSKTSVDSPTFNFMIYNFNSGNWESCDAFTPPDNNWYSRLCNEIINPENYVGGGVIRVRLNETAHQNQADVREDYIQYYVTYTR
jgi:hypothetical protein